ncbi:MAG: EF-hand domain-containing protein [Rubrivivax sp.]|nr:EF-hand domain-containing protein [Rubrivivax sp.]
MISGIGSGAGGMGGMGRMPNMEQMQQMKARMFERADGNASGGLDRSEFTTLMSQGPMGQAGAGKVSEAQQAEAFAKLDSDGNGELAQSELEQGLKALMEGHGGTLASFGGMGASSGASGAGSTAQSAQQDALKVMLDALQSSYGQHEARTSDAASDDPSGQRLSLLA